MAWLHVLSESANDLLLPAQREGQPDRYVLHSGPKLNVYAQSERYGQPLALEEALVYGLETGKLSPLQDYLNAKTSIYNKSSIPSAWQIISWGLSKVGVSGRRSLPTDIVDLSNLEVRLRHRHLRTN